jgi:molybdopterin synthase catalytic subunit
VGRVAVGETAVVVVTASAHRGEAYAANQYIIDRIKREAPIWKREYFTDGASEWGSNP